MPSGIIEHIGRVFFNMFYLDRLTMVRFRSELVSLRPCFVKQSYPKLLLCHHSNKLHILILLLCAVASLAQTQLTATALTERVDVTADMVWTCWLHWLSQKLVRR